MDGIDKKKFPGITIVAATNKAEQISAGYLSAGVYFIKIENDGRYEFFKMMKE